MQLQRLESIDVARGLAALSVAVYHHGFGHALANALHQPAFEAVGWPGAVMAVPVFFVISGFCIHAGGLANPEIAPGRFYLQRLIRFYPAWLAAVLLSTLVLWWGGQAPSTGRVLTHLTLVNGFIDDYGLNVALWSVSVEWFIYLLYPFWLRFRRRLGLAGAALLAAAASTAGCLVTAQLVPSPTGPALWFFVNVWVGWVAGAVLAEIWLHRGSTWLRQPRWWLTGLVLGGLQGLLLWRGSYAGAGLYLKLPVNIVLCVWPLALLLMAGQRIERQAPPPWLRLPWRWLAAIGMFSYSLYLVHVPVQSLRFVLFPHSVASPVARDLLFVAWFGLVLGVAWLSYRFVEEPALRRGRQWLKQWWPEPARPS